MPGNATVVSLALRDRALTSYCAAARQAAIAVGLAAIAFSATSLLKKAIFIAVLAIAAGIALLDAATNFIAVLDAITAVKSADFIAVLSREALLSAAAFDTGFVNRQVVAKGDSSIAVIVVRLVTILRA